MAGKEGKMTDDQRYWLTVVIGALVLVVVILGNAVAAVLRAAGP